MCRFICDVNAGRKEVRLYYSWYKYVRAFLSSYCFISIRTYIAYSASVCTYLYVVRLRSVLIVRACALCVFVGATRVYRIPTRSFGSKPHAFYFYVYYATL